MRIRARAIGAWLLVVAWLAPVHPAWAAGSTAARGRRSMAVMDVAATGNVDAKSVMALSALVASEASRRDDLQVTSGADIRAMLGFERQRELLGCNDASCLAEIGGALGVQFVLASELGTFGGSWLLSVSLVDIRAARTLKRITREAATEKEVLSLARAGVAEVLSVLPRPGAEGAPVAAGAANPPASEPSPTAAPPDAVATTSAPAAQKGGSALGWTSLGVGTVSAAVGGVLYAGAWSDAEQTLTRDEGARVTRNAGLGLGLLVGGAALAVTSYWLFPDSEGASP